MEDEVGLGVGNTEVTFIGLALDQVGAGRLGDDDLGDTDLTGQFPDLGLEQVADRVDRGESSACQVKYPSSRSVLLPVPSGSACSSAERSNRVIIRARAIMLPNRPGVTPAPTAAARPSTPAVISTVRD